LGNKQVLRDRGLREGRFMEKAKNGDFSPGEKEARVLEASKEKLKKDTEKIVTEFFESILDLSEVAIEESRYKIFRSKVLRAGNDAIRDIKKTLEKNYQVLYTPSNEDVVEVHRPKVQPRKIVEG
jgi:hypothetical protein